MSELFTKLFVRSERSHEELISFVADATHGVVKEGWTVISGDYEMDVRPNEDATGRARHERADDFVYYPYTVEVVTEGDPDLPSVYLAFVASLMEALYADGMRVVAACDWECDLPGGGRLPSNAASERRT